MQSNGGLNLQLGTTLTANGFDFQGDSGISIGGGGGAAPALVLTLGGTLAKSAGTGVFVISPGAGLSVVDGTISVASGTLALPGGGSFYSNDTFTAGAGAVLDLVPTNISVNFAGAFSGTGAGQVQLNYGALVGVPASLNFGSGLFQWSGGRMNHVLTNAGEMTLVSTNNHQLWDNPGVGGTDFSNAGQVRQAGGTLDLQSQNVHFHNLASGTYDFTGDGSIISTLWNGTGTFDNAGLVRKSGGTNSVIAVPFSNLGGTIEVDSGSLGRRAGGGGSNGTINVAANAVLAFNGGAFWTWSGNLSGTGAGQVQWVSGALVGSPVSLNFPPGMFQWVADRINGVVDQYGRDHARQHQQSPFVGQPGGRRDGLLECGPGAASGWDAGPAKPICALPQPGFGHV